MKGTWQVLAAEATVACCPYYFVTGNQGHIVATLLLPHMYVLKLNA